MIYILPTYFHLSIPEVQSLEGNCGEQEVTHNNEKRIQVYNTNLWHKLRSEYEKTKYGETY